MTESAYPDVGSGLSPIGQSWARPLDRASGRDETTAPSTQMLRYLRRIDDLTAGALRWGILINGTRWRLYWAGARSISEEFLEIDLGRVLALEGDDAALDAATRDHWLRVFAVMFGREAFLRDGADQRSFHDRARAEAHRSAAMYDDVELMTGELDGFVSFIHALDWLDLKEKTDKALVRLWLDGSFGDPISIARGRLAPATHKVKPEEAERFNEILTQARSLIAEERFLNWQISFPGVWSNWASAGREGGFDAIVGNPPWDRIKLQQVEWFAAGRPEIALAQRASDRAKMIAKLRADGDPLWHDFAVADARAADTPPCFT